MPFNGTSGVQCRPMPRAFARRSPSICVRSSRSRIRLKARWLPRGNNLLFENLAGSEESPVLDTPGSCRPTVNVSLGVKTSKAQDEQMFSDLPFEADLDLRVNEYTCLCRKLDSAIMVMKSAEDRHSCDAAYVLDGDGRDRCVLNSLY
jgi:hypothetical protein